MKRLFILIFVLLAYTACAKYENYPLRPVSFEIGDKLFYSAKDTRNQGNIFSNQQVPVTMSIRQHGDSLDISYDRTTDFLNYEMNGLGMRVKNVEARFEENVRIEFTAPEGIEGYELLYSVPYVSLRPVKTGEDSDEDVYSAVEGWLEFDVIDIVNSTVSGRFEFDAVLYDDGDDCGHPDRVGVRNGSFTDIPFEFLPDQE